MLVPVSDRGGHPQRASIVTRGSRWRRGAQISGVLVVAAALIALTLWLLARDSNPAEVSREFMETDSVTTLYELASDEGDQLLDDGGASAMIDAAEGKRTYADPRRRAVSRTLTFGEPEIQGDFARVTVAVSYASESGPVPDESLGVELVREGGVWRVDSWGIS
ncbi:hypothetical protein GCM10010197_09540 [Nocardioides luteus]|uniref:DUF4878 domain-containing protein n=1 Tax=Nocardioides luteus TaxID=1844 RepID=A0ABQ5SXD2_9ACTN|nr:hypothetical protein GCM10010197_09540 [Nocardioides luteus]GLJ68818.1 hypothetical protein GCM10017579_28540 [Nocardioides luteus]